MKMKLKKIGWRLRSEFIEFKAIPITLNFQMN
jgi:hypothetical protein